MRRLRPLPAAVLASLILAGCVGAACAQDADGQVTPPVAMPPIGTPFGATPFGATAGQTGSEPGTIPQPTPDNPGMVFGITLGELYTDNLKLAPEGKPREGSWITQIQPFFNSAFASPRFSGMFDYKLTGYLYTGSNTSNQLAQDLRAEGTYAVLPQHLFISGTAIYGRQIVNNALPTGSGTFFLNNNLANVASATVSPYWLQDFGNVGTMILRYTYGRVWYNERGIAGDKPGLLSGVPNVTSNGVQFSLTSPPGEVWGWNLGYSEQRLSRAPLPEIEFAAATAGVSRQVSPDLQLLADAGKETSFRSDGTENLLGAPFWDVGFQWSNALNILKFMFGHHFFGHSYNLSWTHTAALLSTTVSYIEQPTNLGQQLLGQNPGEIIISPITGTSLVPSLLNQRVYLMKRASAAATYTMPKGNINLTLYDESREYFTLTNQNEKVANASLAWLFNLGPSTTLTPRVGWQRYRFMTGQVNYDRYGELALIHQINAGNFISIRFRNDNRDAYENTFSGNGNYRVNVIFAQWTHLF